MSMTVTKPAAEMLLILRSAHASAIPMVDQQVHTGQRELVWRDGAGSLWRCTYSNMGRPPWEGQETVQSARVLARNRIAVEIIGVGHVRIGDVCLTPAGGPHVWRYEMLSGPIGLPAAMQVRRILVGPADDGTSFDSNWMSLDEWAALGGDYYTRGAAPAAPAVPASVEAPREGRRVLGAPVPGLPVSYAYDGEVRPFGIVVGVNAATFLVTVFVLHEVNGYKPGCIIENMEMGGDLVLDVTAAAKLTTGIERAPRRPPILKQHRDNGGDVDGFGGEDLPPSSRVRA